MNHTKIISTSCFSIAASLAALSSTTHAVTPSEASKLIDVSCVAHDRTSSLMLEHVPERRLDAVVTLVQGETSTLIGARILPPEQGDDQVPSLWTVNKYVLFGGLTGRDKLTVTKRPAFGRGGCGRGGCDDMVPQAISAKLEQGETTTLFSCGLLL